MSRIHILDKKNPSFISKSGNVFVALLDGATIATLGEFYTAISKALHFPDYFGRNLDALEEMLNDLGWVKEGLTLLIIKNEDELLRDDLQQRREVIRLLKEVDQARLEVCLV